MAGVFELLKGPQKRLVVRSVAVQRADPKAVELQAAMEILAEVFGIKASEVEEMLKQRYEETIEWPQEFCLID